MKNETLQELVAQRRGYKYLDSNGISPYQNYTYDLKGRRIIVTELDTDPKNSCGPGWNLATLKWIANNCLKLDGIIVECNIPKTARIVIPDESNGKFRTDKIKIKKVHKVDSLFPILKDINKRLENYKPVNPITAEKMPPPSKIKKIRNQVRNQVGDQVRNQVGDQVWNQVGDQVRNQFWNQVRNQVGDQVWDSFRDSVWDQVWDQVRNQVWNQVWDSFRGSVWDSVWNQVGDQVRNQVRNQVWNQVWNQIGVCAYHAIAEFFDLDYDHPAFELIRLGIMVVNVLGKFKVFGNGGKYLGEVEP